MRAESGGEPEELEEPGGVGLEEPRRANVSREA